MSAPQVHNVSGRHCKVCNKEFTPQSMTLCIRRKEAGMIIRERVCITCYEDHYGAGE
ncbi:MAG: hypothetical protein HGA20_14935 [Geobacteraceae bacterium]|nr:hypothetical protein [Geobacteraceae bacterium]